VARIVAVADSFDTITHERAYRRATPPAGAFEEIVRCRSSQFDPDVVDALRSIKDRVGLDRIRDLDSPPDAA
jgi:HD-GYP domain-containing protein (c-di-GMP phosphodiesterase class II)